MRLHGMIQEVWELNGECHRVMVVLTFFLSWFLKLVKCSILTLICKWCIIVEN